MDKLLGQLRKKKHLIRPVIIMSTLTGFSCAVIFDVLYLSTHESDWAWRAFWLIAFCVIGAVLMSYFDLRSWFLSILESGFGNRSLELWYGLSNVLITLLFTVSWILRLRSPGTPTGSALVLSSLGVAFSLLTVWVGDDSVRSPAPTKPVPTHPRMYHRLRLARRLRMQLLLMIRARLRSRTN